MAILMYFFSRQARLMVTWSYCREGRGKDSFGSEKQPLLLQATLQTGLRMGKPPTFSLRDSRKPRCPLLATPLPWLQGRPLAAACSHPRQETLGWGFFPRKSNFKGSRNVRREMEVGQPSLGYMVQSPLDSCFFAPWCVQARA